MNVIATFSDRPDPVQPQIPTLGDLKSPYVPMQTPLVLTAPKGTPKEAIAKLEEAVKKTSEDPAFKARATKSNQAVIFMGSEEVRAYAEKLKKEWADTIAVARKAMAEAAKKK